MTLGRTADNKIKIKIDNGTTRAVNCVCCGEVIIPCRDCPPYLHDFQFSLSGDQVVIDEEFQYPSGDGYDPLRTCSDSWDAFGPGFFYGSTNLYIINIERAYGGLFGAPPGTPCCWILSLYVQGYFEYELNGSPDICIVTGGAKQVILDLNPAGSYPITISAQCNSIDEPPTDFNFIVTVS